MAARYCILCLAELPHRWWHRFRLFAPLPICPRRDAEQCHEGFKTRPGVHRG